MTKQNPITIIRRSCTTGQVVWIYQGPTKKATNQAYRRARLKEQSRVRWWGKRMARRAANIKAFLDELVAALPIVGDLTAAQRQAIRTLQTIADSPPPCDTAFHNHCRTERRRRQRDKEIRRKMREREQQEQAVKEAEKNEQNNNYDK